MDQVAKVNKKRILARKNPISFLHFLSPFPFHSSLYQNYRLSSFALHLSHFVNSSHCCFSPRNCFAWNFSSRINHIFRLCARLVSMFKFGDDGVSGRTCPRLSPRKIGKYFVTPPRYVNQYVAKCETSELHFEIIMETCK